MKILTQIWNWLLGKTNIDEKVCEAKEKVTEKVTEAKEYVKNVEKEVSDVVDAVAGKKKEPEVKAFETPVVEKVEPVVKKKAGRPKRKYYPKKKADK